MLQKPGSIIDISVGISADTPVYTDDAPFRLTRHADFSRGDGFMLSSFSMTLHCGTHMDAPLHFVDGASPIDAVPPDKWVLPATVVDMTHAEAITADLLAGTKLSSDEAVLFKTGSGYPARRPGKPVTLTPDGAECLLKQGIALAGIDGLSIESDDDPGFPVHHILLGAGVLILEMIDLSNVEPGSYTLVAAPLKLERAEASPVRAFLIQS
ncbi:MAG: metal-dependent hydrolase [Ectothiorhodospiraceae bacterium]|nr:metal-dependent hydrolase [Ectothiorhodospiraceae bacterium]